MALFHADKIYQRHGRLERKRSIQLQPLKVQYLCCHAFLSATWASPVSIVLVFAGEPQGVCINFALISWQHSHELFFRLLVIEITSNLKFSHANNFNHFIILYGQICLNTNFSRLV